MNSQEMREAFVNWANDQGLETWERIAAQAAWIAATDRLARLCEAKDAAYNQLKETTFESLDYANEEMRELETKVEMLVSHLIHIRSISDPRGATAKAIDKILEATKATAPVIPPDVMKLLRENAELTRKVVEQHNVLKYLMDRFDSEIWQCENCGHAEDTETMDSAIYLREYLTEARQLGGSNE